MKTIIIFIFILIFASAAAEEKLTVRIKYSGMQELEILHDLNIELDHHRTLNEFHAYVTQQQFDELNTKGFQVEVIPNQAKIYFEQLVTETFGTENPMDDYHDYNELTSFLQEISEEFSGITNLFSIGESVQGRELWVMEISDNPGVNEIEPEFKYIANMHGDETPGREFCLYLIEWLCDGYGSDDRATYLVNNTGIFIMPTMNPDGFELGQRYNANGVDLNRDFPDQFDDPSNTLSGRQPETRAIMEWTWEHNFILSANMHSGALVANYPFDGPYSGTYSAAPDDDLFINLSLVYSENHADMWLSGVFEDGITNGAEWYAISGGMQDWNYVWEEDYDITLEQSDTKWPSSSQLPQLWEDNQEAILSYMERIHTGVKGVITDAESGEPLNAEILVEGINHIITTDIENGDYYRLLTPETYTITVQSFGYLQESQTVTITDGDAAIIDFVMEVDPDLETADIEDFETGNFSQFDWEFSGDSNWIIDDSYFMEGSFSARGGNIGPNEETILSITLNVLSDGDIAFYKRVSCEDVGPISGNYYDYLVFQIDGIEMAKWAGDDDWSYSLFSVSEGEHTFAWIFLKDHAVDLGDDTAWIDFVIFPQIPDDTITSGDINFDGNLNILDVVLLVNFILLADDPTDDQFIAADLDGNGDLNVVDIVQLINLILG